jgi:hypothetical protein
MKWFDTLTVALILIGAVLYLYRTFKPKKNKGSSCGCGESNCKVPKPKLGKGSRSAK